MLYLAMRSANLRKPDPLPDGRINYIDVGFVEKDKAYEFDPKKPEVKAAIEASTIRAIEFVNAKTPEAPPNDQNKDTESRSARSRADKAVSKGRSQHRGRSDKSPD